MKPKFFIVITLASLSIGCENTGSLESAITPLEVSRESLLLGDVWTGTTTRHKICITNHGNQSTTGSVSLGSCACSSMKPIRFELDAGARQLTEVAFEVAPDQVEGEFSIPVDILDSDGRLLASEELQGIARRLVEFPPIVSLATGDQVNSEFSIRLIDDYANLVQQVSITGSNDRQLFQIVAEERQGNELKFKLARTDLPIPTQEESFGNTRLNVVMDSGEQLTFPGPIVKVPYDGRMRITPARITIGALDQMEQHIVLHATCATGEPLIDVTVKSSTYPDSTFVDSTEATSSGTKVSLRLNYPKEGVVCDTLIVTANGPSGDTYRVGVPLSAIVLTTPDVPGDDQ